MARVFIDGFEQANLTLWLEVDPSVNVVTNAPNSPSPRTLYIPYGNIILKPLPSAVEYYVAFRLYPKSGYILGGTGILKFMHGGTVLGVLDRQQESTGRLRVWRGDYAAWLQESTAAIPWDTWEHIEVRYYPHTSSGIFQVIVGEDLWIDFFGATSPSNLPINMIQFGQTGSNGSTWYLDDVVVDNAEWPGESYIRYLYPTGQFTAEWTPSAGSNYACVDETPPSTADYVSTTEVGKTDVYQMSYMPDTDFFVRCVQASVHCLREGVPSGKQIQFVIRDGVDDYLSPAYPLPLVSYAVAHLWEASPVTGNDFTEAEVNSLRTGFKSVA